MCQVLSVVKLYSENKTELSGPDKKHAWRNNVGDFKPKDTLPAVRHGGSSIMLLAYFDASGTGALHKEIMMRKYDDKFFNSI